MSGGEKQTPKQRTIPEITNKEEYDKLPRGTQYKRDGKLYRKK